ncbi:GNAT family N-acetyltransferase [Aestuariibius sp. HNIBRBA575]|uniref:GNAT family N-acetyltransferase n=1 Tax=Aestuariibius sp. HNIBRBA575 TaxID=3233343 RepID=UPI0034A222A9
MMLDRVTNQADIETPRFTLRPLRRSDSGLVEMYAADERVARMTKDIPHPLPPGAVAAMIEKGMKPDRDEDIWVIDGLRSDFSEVMGLMVLKPLERKQSEVSYWIAPAFWNTGIATEAVTALIAANPQKNDQIFAEVFQDNPGSARVLTNCGFDYLGDAEAVCVSRDATVPTWTYIRKM